MTQQAQTNLSRYPLVLFFGSMVLSLAGTIIIATLFLNLPGDDIQQLVFFMGGTGILTTISSYTFYRLGLLQWFGSLRWTLLVTIMFTVALVLMIVWLLAQLMFIDSHYITLTSTLLVFAGLTSISFGFFVSQAMTDRLGLLSAAAGKLAEGDLTARLEVKGNDEIAQVSEMFNTMAQNLQEVDEQKQKLEQARRDLIAWVSHDLRTPLTSMRAMLEAISDGVVSDEETVDRYVRTSLAEIQHLNHLITDLFELAKLDVGHLSLDFQEASLSDLISDTIGAMKRKAEQKQISLTGQVAKEIDIVHMAPDKIQRVLLNLVQNAIEYTPANERVLIKAMHCGDHVQVDVHNSGVTIPKEDLERIFESFYRGERSRAKSDDGERGTGLGLAIARGFIEAHRGRIWVNSDKSGTTFSFTIPVKTAA